MFAAAIGHLLFGDFRMEVTAALLAGSIPGVYLGSKVSSRAPAGLIRRFLVVVLVASSLKMFGMEPVPLAWTLLAFLGAAGTAWLALRLRDARKRDTLPSPVESPVGAGRPGGQGTSGPTMAHDRSPDGRWPHDTVDVLGVRVNRIDAAHPAVHRVGGQDRTKLTVTFANPDYVLKAQKDTGLRELMNGFDSTSPTLRRWREDLRTSRARADGERRPHRRPVGQPAERLAGVPVRQRPGVAEKAAENARGTRPEHRAPHGHWADEDGRIPAETAERLVAGSTTYPRHPPRRPGRAQQRFVAGTATASPRPSSSCGACFEHLAERRST